MSVTGNAPGAAPHTQKNAQPSAAIIDSQSVKCADMGRGGQQWLRLGDHQTQRSGQGISIAAKARWVVERTFGWLMKSRGPVRDHGRKPSQQEAFVYLAMIGFATHRLTQ